MPRNQKTQAQLQAEINRLKAENQQFRLVFRIIIETAYQVVNKDPEPAEAQEPEPKKEETC